MPLTGSGAGTGKTTSAAGPLEGTIVLTSNRTIAIVTGANRGLGLETCRQLRNQGFQIVLTSRGEKEGFEAARRLDPEAREVLYHPLDVTDPNSIATLVAALPRLVPRIDVLVNNAGVGLDGQDAETTRRTLAVNYFGARDVTDALLSSLPTGGRVVMVSSGLGELTHLAPDLRPSFADPTLTRSRLDALVSSFLQAVQTAKRRDAGWPSAYSVSKVSLNALARILARDLAPRGVSVNAVCPGWVRTDMGGRRAPRSVAVGARSIVLAATLPSDVTGGFYRDGRRIPW